MSVNHEQIVLDTVTHIRKLIDNDESLKMLRKHQEDLFKRVAQVNKDIEARIDAIAKTEWIETLRRLKP